MSKIEVINLILKSEKNEKIIQSQWFFRHDKNASTQCGCI